MRVLEYEKDLSVRPDNAIASYYASEMNVRRRQLLLELKGDPEAYGIAGLTAAIVAGPQIVGGLSATRLRSLFRHRTSALIAATAVSSLALLGMGVFESFWPVVALVLLAPQRRPPDRDKNRPL